MISLVSVPSSENGKVIMDGRELNTYAKHIVAVHKISLSFPFPFHHCNEHIANNILVDNDYLLLFQCKNLNL